MIKIALILFAILPYPLRRDLRTNFYRYYFKAVHYIKNGNIDKAFEEAQLAYNTVRDKKEAFLSLNLLGAIRAYKGEYQDARYFLESSLQLAQTRKDSITVEPWLLYVLYYDSGLYGTYELAKKFDMKIPEELIFRALYLIDEGNYEKSIATVVDVNSHMADYIKAYAFYRLNMLDSALFYLSKLDTLNSVEKVFYSTLLYKNRDYAKAYKLVEGTEKTDVFSVLLQALIESKVNSENLFNTYTKYRELLKNKPEFSKIALITARMYFHNKKYTKMVWVLEDALPYLKGKYKEEAFYLLGTGYMYLKRYASALNVFKKYRTLSLEHYDYSEFQIGRAAYELELDSMAIEHLLRLHDTSAYYFWGLYLCSRILVKKSQAGLALPIFEYIADHPVERSLKRRVYYNLGKLFISSKEWDSASLFFKKTMDLGFEGADIDTSEYYYEYCALQNGKYKSPVELNSVFSKKYSRNSLIPSLLFELYTYYIAQNQKDSALTVLLSIRERAGDSIYMLTLHDFLNSCGEDSLMDTLKKYIEARGNDRERVVLARRLLKMGDPEDVIEILENVNRDKMRGVYLLFARAYESMGKSSEAMLILKEAFPPFDSIGQKAFVKLTELTLKTEGMDSFYSTVFKDDVPNSLKQTALKNAVEELFENGDTLNALEIKSRLKELEKSDDIMEGN